MMVQVPIEWASVITALILLALTLAFWRIPLARILQDAPDHARWRDLRVWATLLVAVQLGIYYLFS